MISTVRLLTFGCTHSLNVLEETDKITFNAAEIDFSSASVLDGVDTLHHQISQSADEKQERVSFHFPQKFKKGSSIKLNVGWKAKLNNSMMGRSRLNISARTTVNFIDLSPPSSRLLPLIIPARRKEKVRHLPSLLHTVDLRSYYQWLPDTTR
jgi:Peptidase M1 N-terminal domain